MTTVTAPETLDVPVTSDYDHRVLYLSGTWTQPDSEFRFRATFRVVRDGSAEGVFFWQAVRVHGRPASYFAREWAAGHVRGREVELKGFRVEPGLSTDDYRITLDGADDAGPFGGITRTYHLDWRGRIWGQYAFRNRKD